MPALAGAGVLAALSTDIPRSVCTCAHALRQWRSEEAAQASVSVGAAPPRTSWALASPRAHLELEQLGPLQLGPLLRQRQRAEEEGDAGCPSRERAHFQRRRNPGVGPLCARKPMHSVSNPRAAPLLKASTRAHHLPAAACLALPPGRREGADDGRWALLLACRQLGTSECMHCQAGFVGRLTRLGGEGAMRAGCWAKGSPPDARCAERSCRPPGRSVPSAPRRHSV